MNQELTERPFDLAQIFDNTPHLHLICWNLFDIELHKKGLILLGNLLSSKHFQGRVLTMLRPAGRKDLNDYEGSRDSYGALETPGVSCGGLPPGASPYAYLCELWIQASSDCENEIWGQITKWIDTQGRGFGRRSMTDPIWRPYASSLLNEKKSYACFRDEFMRKEKPSFIYELIPDKQIPWLLKAIWGRSSGPIVSAVVKGDSARLVHPLNDCLILKKMYQAILADVDLEAHGFSCKKTKISPWLCCASHMSLFAVNAAVIGRDYPWRLEHYYDHRITRPYYYESLGELLSQFNG